MRTNLENSAVTKRWPDDWKRSVIILIPKKGNAKECSNYRTIALISHSSKVMLKILQARLQQYMNYELPHVQAEFRKGRGTWDQTDNICWIIKKAREFQKNIYFCFIDYAKAFDCVEHNNLREIILHRKLYSLLSPPATRQYLAKPSPTSILANPVVTSQVLAVNTWQLSSVTPCSPWLSHAI